MSDERKVTSRSWESLLTFEYKILSEEHRKELSELMERDLPEIVRPEEFGFLYSSTDDAEADRPRVEKVAALLEESGEWMTGTVAVTPGGEFVEVYSDGRE